MRRGLRGSEGATIVELIVAVALLGLVVVALAGSSLYTSRLLAKSKGQLGSAELVQRELERLLALPYDSLSDGSRTLTDGSSTWTIEDLGNHREIVLITHYTPAPRISVWDTVATYRLEP